jgi:hypothetical protein
MHKQCPTVRGLLWPYGAGTPSAALAHAFTGGVTQGWRTLATGALTRRSTLGRPVGGLHAPVCRHGSSGGPLLILEKQSCGVRAPAEDDRQGYRRLVRRGMQLGMLAEVPTHADQAREWVSIGLKTPWSQRRGACDGSTSLDLAGRQR